MIRLEGLGGRIGGFALDDISLEVPEGSYGLVIGPTGSGKTTLLEAIAGHLPIETGRIHLHGSDVTAEPPERRGVGVVYQRVHLFPHLNVADNIAYGMRRVQPEAVAARVQELGQQLGLGSILQRPVADLSGGEAQRVALARAMAPRPKTLLLDEPFASLDPGTRREFRRQLLDLQEREGVTTLQVTHDFEEALGLGDVVAVMMQGRILQSGSPEAVFRNPSSAFVARFLGLANVLAGRVTREEDDENPGPQFSATFATGDLALEVIAEREGGCHAIIHPEDVVLSRERPHGSARNTLSGTVADLDRSGPITHVTVDAGQALRASITTASATNLALAPGQPIFATIKTTAIQLV